MTKKIDPIEKELNKIRRRIYEETKGMTHEQYNEYFNASAEELAKEYGFDLIASANGNEQCRSFKKM